MSEVNKIILFFIMMVTWLVLSGHFTFFFILTGMVCSGVCVWLVSLLPQEKEMLHLKSWWRFPGYVLWLLKEIVVSSIEVALQVWKPEMAISPGYAFVPTRQGTDTGRVIYANSITLTPGTVSITVQPKRIWVHALKQEALKQLQEGAMDTRIYAITKGTKGSAS